ncbi:non-ribosomal peptide synthase/polyketide synthase [Pseudonocardia dioxanivorans]|uniref:non-ribosomal peptide synthase/polyketide synthase n=1 Tax=Pseudonocardia dioxanivorans TaxID=240495 RepID=UPI000CD27ECC|nr:non-ribosomal peptide synthase/polyketide synthase [Pseudonocardia dioxanivorans]
MSIESAERLLPLAEWNDPEQPAHTTTVVDLFAGAAAAHPGVTALVARGRRPVRLTYAELARHVHQLAHHLLAGGLTAEQVVAVHLPRSPEMVISVLAIMAAGGAFVPVDPEWPEQRRRQVLADAGAVHMVTTADDGDPLVPASVVDLGAWRYADRLADRPDVRIEPERLAYVMFTSGSTGTPKGAMIRHAAIANRLEWQVHTVLGFGPGDASLFKAPLSFDISVNEILLPLVSGGHVVVADPGGDRDPHHLFDLIATEGVTFVYLVPSMLDALLEMARGTAGGGLDGLRHVWCGGEALTPELFRRFRARLTTTMYHGYGPAEATIGVTHAIYRPGAERSDTSIGRPNPYTQIHVLDERLRPVPVGVGGELYAAGFLLGRGYVNAPGVTAARFVANPFDPTGARLYRTGDLARWHPDGTLEFLGRVDNQVKIRGMRLEPEEVEAALAAHPAVRQAVVAARSNSAGAKYLAAYVLLLDPVTEDELRGWCADRLPEYMVPTTVTVLDTFPLTPNGKVDRRALPEPQRPAREPGRAPRTPREATLCAVVAEVLGLPEVGADDDFFTLGGDSIVAIGLVSRVRREGLEIRPSEVFELRTPAALALAARDAAGAEPSTVAPVGELPATPVVEWLHATGPSEGFYQSITLHAPAALTTERLAELTTELLARHDVLRARVRTGADGRPRVDVPAGPAAPSVTHVRLDPDEPVADRVRQETVAAAARLDASAGRMLEVVRLDRGPDAQGRVLLVVHHVVVDGVSLRVLAEDLGRAWAGADPQPATTSFREWALRLDEATRAGTFDDDLPFWRAAAAAPNPVLGNRPLDPATDTVATERALTVTVPSALTGPLLGSVPAAIHGGVNDALVAALALAVRAWRGHDRILVEMEGHGREAELLPGHPLDLSRTVGWFTTLYPVPLEVADGSLAEVVRSVKEQLRAVPRHGLGYGALRFLGGHEELSVAPSLLFNYLGRFPAGSGADWSTADDAAAGDERVLGEDRDPRMPLPRALEVNAITVDTADGPVLSARFSWPAAVLDAADVRALADEWVRLLGAIATDDTVAGHTPSDFPLVPLTAADVAELEREVPALQDVLPLLPLQQGMYFHATFGDGSVDPYRIQQVAELTGPLDPEVLRAAVATMVDRHPALRAGFRGLADGRIVQVVSGHVEFEWRVVDLTGSADPAAGLAEVTAAERARPFDLARPPLVRWAVVSLTPTEHRLVQTLHHIVADGWSYPLMFNDVVDAYRGTLRGVPAVALGRHVAAVAGADAERDAQVWAEALAEVEEPTLLVDADPGAAVGEHRIAAEELSVDRSAALTGLARDLGVTLSTVLHAAWGLVLGRTLGEDTVVFGSTVSGRAGQTVPGVESVVGLLINTVPVAMSWTKAEPVDDVVRRLQDRQTAVLEHQHVGLAELARSRGLRTLFDTLVIVENFPEVYGPQDDGPAVRGFTSTTFSHYPVSLVAFPGERLTLQLKYDVDLVAEHRARDLLDRVLRVLDQLAADPRTPVGRLELVDAAARTTVVEDFNDTELDLGAPTLRSRFEHWVRETPDTTAVVFEGSSVSYAELDRRANLLAHDLLARGVSRGSVVAVRLERSIELIVALYAVHKAGAAYLPVDPGYPAERIAFVLEDARPVVVLDDPAAFPVDGDPANPDTVVTPADPAYVIYTSGSTGRPKGVVVPHGAAANFLTWMQERHRLEPGEPTLQKTPTSFDASLRELFWPLMSGATMVLAKPEGHKDAAYLAALIAEHEVTTVQFVPSMFAVFLEEPAVRELTSLRRVICGGEVLPADVVRRFAALSDAELHNVYGPTEAAIDVTAWDTRERPVGASVPVGRPVANTRLYVLDGALRPVPPGVTGELYLAGVQLAHGYLNRPGLTAERFVADPFVPGARMYRSGDVARWDETGVLEVTGRVDHQVQVRGFRIEPGEIESALVAAGATRAVVVVRDGRLVGYVTGPTSSDALVARVAEVLPEHMVPAIVVALEAFPSTPNGKLDRAALPAPDFAGLVSDRAPRTPVEERLAALFADALALDRVGIDDDFFALGGDSITSIAVSGRARRAGLRITPRDVFRLRTVAALAGVVDDVVTDTGSARDEGIGPVPLVPVMAEAARDRIPLANFFQSALLRTPEGLTGADLDRILAAVLARHGLLRAVVEPAGDAWTVEVPAGTTPPTVVVEPGAVSAQTVERATREAAAALDPARGALLRAVWFRDARALLLVAHHLVVDGVSWRILGGELAAAWDAVRTGTEELLAPVETSYATWSRTLREAAAAGRFRAELEHWRAVLATPDPDLGDRPLDAGVDVQATTDTVTVTLPPFAGAAQAIHGRGDDVLVAAFAIALHRWRRDRGVDAGPATMLRVKGHGRESALFGDLDLSRTVGSFTSVYPVRVDPGDVSAADVDEAGAALARAVKTVKEQLRVPSAGVGYGVLRHLDPDADLPDVRPQVVLNYRGRGQATDGDWAPLPGFAAVGSGLDPAAPVDALEINVLGEGDAGTATLTWPTGILGAADVRALARRWTEVLDAVARCPDLRGHTPSDFPLVSLRQDEVAALEAAGPVEDVWPLSPLQAGLYFQARFADTSAEGVDVYLAQDSIEFETRLDVDALTRAATLLLDQNSALRLGFTDAGLDAPVAVLPPRVAPVVTEIDLSGLTPAERAERTAAIMAEDRRTPFDLARPPLFRLAVLRGDGRDHLLMTRHLILWDGWSRELVLRRLFGAYEAYRRGDAAALPAPATARFPDYLGWLAEQDDAAAAAAWAQAFADVESPTIMFPEAVGSDPVIATRLSVELSEADTARLSARARELGVTLNSVVATALGLVLGHAAGTDDVVFGMTVSGRPAEVAGVESVVGVFLNTIPARVRLDPADTVADAVRGMHEQRAAMMPFEHLGLGEVQRAVGRGQLFDNLYVLQNFVDDEALTDDLRADHGIVSADGVDSTHYPLTWVVYPGPRLWVKLEHRSDVVAPERAAGLLARLEQVLLRLADGLDERVAAIDLTTPADRAARMAEWARAEHEIGTATIADLLAERAAAVPEETALVFGDTRVGYADLDARINRLAHHLLAAGAGPEKVVGLALPRSIEMVVALFAVLRTGAAYLPLELEQPDDRLHGMIADARPLLVLSTSAVSARFPGAVELDRLDLAVYPDTAPTAEQLGAFAPGRSGRLDHPAYVIFTSGSTGKPKGVVTPYRGLTNMQLNHRAEIFDPTVAAAGGRRLTIAHTVSFSFDMSWEELLWLVEGHEVHVCDEELRRDARALVDYCRTHGVDVVNVTPTYARVLLEEGLVRRHPLALMLLGGEAVPEALWTELRETTLGYNLYGPTEYTINTLGAGTRDSATSTVGRPIHNTRAYVLDQWLRPVDDGVVGELYIAGAGLARGYLDRRGNTADRFVADPWNPGGRMYRTGDLVRRRPDGNLDFLGRSDDQVKIRGYRVEPGEIEAALAARPGVRRAAVVVRTDADVKRLAAYVVPGGSVEPADLAEAVARVLPDYMVPTLWGVVDDLPLTVNGKLDVAALPAPRPVARRGGRAPRTGAERLLVEIVAAVVGLDVTDVSPEDDFFTLGGDSISSITLCSRARKAGLELAPRDVFRRRTVEALAAAAGRATGAPAVRDDGVGDVPNTPILAAFQDMPLANFYQSSVLRTPAGMTRDELETVLAAVLARHDLLRARVVGSAEGGWHLTVPGPGGSVPLEVTDGRPSREQMAAATRAAAAALDARAGTMVRAHWFRAGDGPGSLLLVVHHLVVDGVSWRILGADLEQAWAAVRAGRAPELEEVATSFRTWATRMRTAADEGRFRGEAAYWRDVLATPDPDLGSRPLDPAVDVAATTDDVVLELPSDVTGPLLSTVPAAIFGGVNDVLLAGFALAVGHWRRVRGRAEDAAVLLTLEGHGREPDPFDAAGPLDLSRTVGWFTSLHPVRLDPGTPGWDAVRAGGPELARAVKAVKDQLRVPNRGIGHGVLADLDPAAGLPVVEPQILFNYLGRFATGAATDWGSVEEYAALGEGVDPSSEVRALSVNAITHDTAAGPEFSATLTFPTGILARAEVEQLAALWGEALRAIASAEDLAGHTPADFPLVTLTADDVAELETTVPGGPVDVLPLLPLQQGMYFHSVQAEGRDPYVIQHVLELRGTVDPDLLRQAVAAMVARHDVLRAGFRELSDGRVAQVLAADVPLPWETCDLREHPERFDEVAAERFRTVFDLAAPPLLRYLLVRLADDRHRLVQTMHHLLADGWSYPLMFNDIAVAYGQLVRTGQVSLPAPSVTFADHVAVLAGRAPEASRKVWADVLAQVDGPTRLVDAEPGTTSDAPHAAAEQVLDADVSARLLDRVRAAGVTISTAVHGVWGLLLGRTLGRERVVFGSTVSGRGDDTAGIEEIVGPMINTVPVPLAWSPGEPVCDVLARLQEQQLTVLEHQHLGLTELARVAGVAGELFDTIVVVENFLVTEAATDPTGSAGLPELEWIDGTDAAHYPVSLVAHPGDRLRLKVTYDTGRVDEATAERLVGRLAGFLAQLADDPDVTVAGLSTGAEVASAPQLVPAPGATLPELFRAVARAHADAVAVRDGRAELTYADLDARSDALAVRLAAHGVRAGTRVAITLPRSADVVVAVLGVLKAGACYVPIDPGSPPSRVAHILADSRPDCVLAAEGTAALLPADGPAVLTLDGLDPARFPRPSRPPAPAGSAEADAYVIYTSGSTGLPKGVAVPHRAVTSLFEGTSGFGFGPDDVWTLFHSYAFDFSVWEIWGALLHGGRLVVVDDDVVRDPQRFRALLSDERVTVLNQTPSAFRSLVAADRDDDRPLALRHVVFGGEALDLRRLAPWYARHADTAPRLTNMYGITETCVHVTVRPLTAADATRPDSVIGVALPTLAVHVLDQYLQPVPAGVVGEVYVAGSQLARGYLDRPGLTAARFVASPFVPGERLYRSGDLARWTDDGELVHLGRSDHQVQLRGYRIEPGEVEAALLQVDGVDGAAVGVQHDAQGRPRLVAHLVAPATLDTDAVRRHAQTVLPAHMVPALYAVVDRLPLTVNGKLDRDALPAIAAPAAPAAPAAAGPPASGVTAETLAALFGEILDVPVGVDDDFFAAGGDSIIALQLVNRCKRLGLRIAPRDVFTHRTPAALAALAAPGGGAAPPSHDDRHEDRHEDDPDAIGPVMLTPIVHRLAELGGRIDRFNQSELLVTPAGATPEQIGAVVTALLRRHDALRLRLSRPAPMLWALETVRDLPALDDVLTVVDGRGLHLPELLGTVSDAAADRLAPDAGRMLAAVFVDRGDEPGRLLLVVHHLAVDGVSWRILDEDARTAWEAVAQGRVPVLEPVATSLRTHARLLNESSAQQERLAEFPHWTEVLAAGAELDPQQLLVGRTIGETREHRFRLTAAQTQPLLTTVPAAARADVTETLLTGLRVGLSRWRAAQGVADGDVAVDLERHGRDDLPGAEVDLARTVGWFTSIAPVRLPVPDGEPLDRVGAVRDRLRAAPDGGRGYGLLRYCNARTAAALARLGQPQVLFNYLGRFAAAGDVVAWGAAPESGALRVGPSPDMGTPYLLEVNAYCEDGPDGPELEVVLTYLDGGITAPDELGDAFADALRELAAAAGGTARLTPADVHHRGLTAAEVDAVTAGTSVAVTDVWPLSPLQEGLFVQAELAADADVYLAQNAFDFDRRLDAGRMAAAFEHVLAANAATRLGFTTVADGRPVAFVGDGLGARLTEIDLDGLDTDTAARRVDELTAADRTEAFDLRQPPLARLTVLHLPGGRDRLLFTYHLLLWDGWSRELVLTQLFDAYRGEPGPPPRGRFTDYLDWIGARDAAASAGFWRESFADLPAPTLLRPEAAGSEPVLAQRLSVEVPEDVTARLTAQARGVGVTLNALVSTALALVLGHATGSSDVVLGTTVAGRPTELDDIDDVVGVFLNTVPARVRLDPAASVADTMRQVQRDRVDAMEHEYLGLGDIQRAVGRGQLFDNLYVLQNFLDDDTFSDLETRNGIVGVASVDATHYPLTWVVMPGRRLWVKLEHRPDLVDATEAAALLGRLESVLTYLADADLAGSPLAAVPIPADDAPAGAERPLPDRTIAELLAEQAAATPDAEALTCGDTTLTYRELDAAVSRTARLLVEHGAGPERVVALALPRSTDMVVALFAVLRTGAAYLPLELDHPDERLRGLVADAAPVLLLTTSAVAPRTAGWGVPVVDLAVSGSRDGDAPDGPDPHGPGHLDHPAYVIYTSGSTGRPKGVVTPYRGLTNMLQNHRESIFAPVVAAAGRRLRIAHTVSFSFDMSWEELLWLVEGHHVHVADEELRRDATALVAYCARHRIDVVNVTPTYAEALLDEGLLAGVHRPPLVLLGGENVPERLWATLRDTDGVLGYNLYGPTEYTINTLGAGTTESATSTVGRPIHNTTAHVLDAWLRPVPVGVPGELYIAGVGLARGYLNRPGLTAERFVADPFVPGGRLYRTGDLVRVRADGNIDFLGRTDDQIKIRGHRIELGEVQAAVAAAPGVRQAAVLAEPDGVGGKRLAAYLVGEEAALDPATVQRAVKHVLPGHMVPTAWAVTDALPLTVNGKLDTSRLPVAVSVSSGGRPPATVAERALCALFGEVLDVPADGPEAFGVEDDFFDRGGHSLVAIRLLGRIRAELGADLSLRDLFDGRTPERVAARIAGTAAAGPARPALVATAPEPGRVELAPRSPSQDQLWLLHRLDPTSTAYQYPLVLRLAGHLDRAVLQAAVADVVARHEALRTLVDDAGQHVLPAADVPVTDDVADALHRPFDLAAEVPIRVAVAEESDGHTVLALVLHHIAMDEWSDGILLRDLSTAYAARLAGSVPQWAPLPARYADYARWQAELLGDPDDPDSGHAAAVRFWREQLRGLPTDIDLSGVLPADAGTATGGAVEADLPADLVRPLRELAAGESASLFMLLHAALSVLLHRLGAGDDIAIGTPTSGRTEPELAELVGFFVNPVVLRVGLTAGETFVELLRRVRAGDLAAFEQATLPFPRVVEAVNPPRSADRNPLFHVMLGYLAQPGGEPAVCGLPARWAAQSQVGAKFDLDVTALDHGDAGVTLVVEWGPGLGDRAAADRLVERFVGLLRAVAADPDVAVGRIDVRTDDERAQPGVLVGPDRSGGVAVPQLLEAVAADRPDAPALVTTAGRLTFAQLADRVGRIATLLRGRGVGPEVVVALALPRAQTVPALLGVLAAGGTALPLDVRQPEQRTRFVLDDARPALVVTTAEWAGTVPDTGVPRLLLDREPLPAPTAPLAPHPDSAAYVIYTSGSTGRPKGVTGLHRGLANLYGSHRADLVGPAQARLRRDRLRVAHAASFTFDGAWDPLMWMLAGHELHVLDEQLLLDPPALRAHVAEHDVDLLDLTPTYLRELAALGFLEPAARRPGVVVVGGEQLPAVLAEQLRALPDVEVHDLYGPTEFTVDAYGWHSVPGDGPGTDTRTETAGPVANTRALVLDDALLPCPVGVPGELYLAGAGLTRGYLRRPGLTAARFVAAPDGSRMYRTGDLVRRGPDGRLTYLGRTDDQVKLRGLRIEPGEIEAALATHPQVAHAAVVVREDTPGRPLLVAYVVPAGEEVLAAAALRAHLAARLPEQWLPTAYVPVPELPRTSSGKLDRAALPAPLAAASVGRPAATRTERALAVLVGDLLGIPAPGADEDFFALGGHSLMLVGLAAAIRRELGVEVTIAELFTAPSVAAMARLVDGDRSGADALAPVLPLRVGGSAPPLFVLPPASGLTWQFAALKRHLPDDVPLYGLQAPRLSRATDLPTTLAALADEHARHVTEIAPTGPVRLLGWSFGGFLAHELACRLRAAGREVTFVGMLDAHRSGGTSSTDLGGLLRELGHEPPAGAEPGLDDAVALLRAGGDGVAAVLTDEQVAAVVANYLDSDRMIDSARPGVLDADVFFVDATVPEQGFSGSASAGWRDHVRGELHVEQVACGHSQLLDHAVLAQLAPALAAALAT